MVNGRNGRPGPDVQLLAEVTHIDCDCACATIRNQNITARIAQARTENFHHVQPLAQWMDRGHIGVRGLHVVTRAEMVSRTDTGLARTHHRHTVAKIVLDRPMIALVVEIVSVQCKWTEDGRHGLIGHSVLQRVGSAKRHDFARAQTLYRKMVVKRAKIPHISLNQNLAEPMTVQWMVIGRTGHHGTNVL